jgi:septum formation protein
MLPPVLCLASASPRRTELLRQLGVPHEVRPASIDESLRAGEPAEAYVRRMAVTKAGSVRSHLPVLGADTSVIVDEDVLGKPGDLEAARAMLARLSGREHIVLSAVALAHAGAVALRLSRTTVRFRVLGSAEIDAYWATGEPGDKAGSYAIQGFGSVFVESLSGSHSGVVGLPLFETAQLLAEAGVPVWQGVR